MITRLPIEPEKLVSVILYIASRIPDPTKFKLSKLIFLADFAHLGKYGRPIVGGRYCAMTNGPVPSEVLDLLNLVLNNDSPSWAPGAENAFDVQDGQYPKFIPKLEADASFLSESDVEIMDEIIHRYGSWGFWALYKYTHDLPAYIKAVEKEQDAKNPSIDYEDFFENNPFAIPGTKEELLENYALSRAFPQVGV